MTDWVYNTIIVQETIPQFYTVENHIRDSCEFLEYVSLTLLPVDGKQRLCGGLDEPSFGLIVTRFQGHFMLLIRMAVFMFGVCVITPFSERFE